MFLRSYHVEYEQFFHPALLGYRAECRGNISIARDISAILASIRRPRKYPGLYSASLQKYCASVEKIIRDALCRWQFSFRDGDGLPSSSSSSPPPSLSSFFCKGIFIAARRVPPETYSRIDENRVEITYS